MIKTSTKKVIEDRDWDDLVEKTYGRTYKFQQQDGCKNRGIHNITIPIQDPEDYGNDKVPEVVNGEKMGVSFKAWLARNPKEWNGGKKEPWTLELFWERNFYPHIDMIANDLYSKGLIEAGEYMINIDW